ncbi:fatty-acid amide hydrolase 2 [Camelus ferus]|uniref:Fatty-acid amide hydrolase 2 n=1 Tax=Camelus ferus TaxID=419612 RepID=A0A8B8SMT2_CAMFR|nr:fatty-acid amide hydrolase 2 [Camelus ferus]
MAGVVLEFDTVQKVQVLSDVKCIDVVQAYINRIKDVNSMINGIVMYRFEAAKKEARAIDKKLAENQEDEATLEKKWPFLGVPLTVKEAFQLKEEIKARINKWDLMKLTSFLALSSGPPLAPSSVLLPVPVGKLIAPPPNTGSGLNSHAVLLRAQVVLPCASTTTSCSPLQSPGAASVQPPLSSAWLWQPGPAPSCQPASRAGCVVPNKGQFPMAMGAQEQFQCTGPMCRYAEDLAPMLRVMAGPGIKKLKLNDKVNLKDLKFYWMEHDGGSYLMSKVDQDLILAQKKVVAHLETILGVSVQHVKLKQMKYSFQLWVTMMSAKGHDGKEPVKFVDLLGDHGKPIKPLWELIKWCLGLSVHTIPSIGLALLEEKLKYNNEKCRKFKTVEESLHKELTEMLGDDGIFLYPSHPTVAPKHHVPLTRPFNFAYTGT